MEYYSPRDLNEAYALLQRYGEAAIPIAGSTFFMGHREELFDEVEAVIDIKRLGLGYIRLEGNHLKIGATTTLAAIHGQRLGFVTAPGGRNLLVPTLEARGARVQRAEVYRREPIPLAAPALAALAALQAPACLLLSSGGALHEVLSPLSAPLAARLRTMPVVAASERLGRAAHEAGFARVVLADGPRPAQLMKAACTIGPAGIR